MAHIIPPPLLASYKLAREVLAPIESLTLQFGTKALHLHLHQVDLLGLLPPPDVLAAARDSAASAATARRAAIAAKRGGGKDH